MSQVQGRGSKHTGGVAGYGFSMALVRMLACQVTWTVLHLDRCQQEQGYVFVLFTALRLCTNKVAYRVTNQASGISPHCVSLVHHIKVYSTVLYCAIETERRRTGVLIGPLRILVSYGLQANNTQEFEHTSLIEFRLSMRPYFTYNHLIVCCPSWYYLEEVLDSA